MCPRWETHILSGSQTVEAKMPTVITGGKTYAAAASTRRESKSVQCQTSLTWVFSDCPLRTTESNMRSSGRPGSVSTGTQASSGKLRTVSADARFRASLLSVLRRRIGVQLIPPKRPLGVLPIPQKWHLRVLQLLPKAHLRVQQVHDLKRWFIIFEVLTY